MSVELFFIPEFDQIYWKIENWTKDSEKKEREEKEAVSEKYVLKMN